MCRCHVQLTPSWAQSTSTPNRMYFSPDTGRIISSKAEAYMATWRLRTNPPGPTGFLYLQVKLSIQFSEVQQFAGRGAEGPAGATNTQSGALALLFFCWWHLRIGSAEWPELWSASHGATLKQDIMGNDPYSSRRFPVCFPLCLLLY